VRGKKVGRGREIKPKAGIKMVRYGEVMTGWLLTTWAKMLRRKIEEIIVGQEAEEDCVRLPNRHPLVPDPLLLALLFPIPTQPPLPSLSPRCLHSNTDRIPTPTAPLGRLTRYRLVELRCSPSFSLNPVEENEETGWTRFVAEHRLDPFLSSRRQAERKHGLLLNPHTSLLLLPPQLARSPGLPSTN
jgi:hypothetical protein